MIINAAKEMAISRGIVCINRLITYLSIRLSLLCFGVRQRRFASAGNVAYFLTVAFSKVMVLMGLSVTFSTLEEVTSRP